MISAEVQVNLMQHCVMHARARAQALGKVLEAVLRGGPLPRHPDRNARGADQGAVEQRALHVHPQSGGHAGRGGVPHGHNPAVFEQPHMLHGREGWDGVELRHPDQVQPQVPPRIASQTRATR